MFAKIFTQILDSSLADDYLTRLVFEDMLKLCDLNGVVDLTHEAISRRTNVPLEIVKRGIEKLEKPDKRSRTPEHEGKRIVRLDDHREWGWLIVNYSYYRNIASEEQRREKTLARVRKHRGKADPVTPCNATVTPCNATVTHDNACNAMQREKQREMDMEKEIPPNPQRGDRGSVKKKPETEEAKLINDIYHRKSGWSEKEIKAFKKLFPIDRLELFLVKQYTEAQRALGEDGRHRRDLLTFLNNYHGEVDRAKQWKSEPAKKEKSEYYG